VFGHDERERPSWSASRGSGVFRVKHGVPVHFAPASRVRQHAGDFLEAEICRCRSGYVRPTCATLPTCLPVPALVAPVLSGARWLRPSRDGSRDTTFHDVVARFRRIAGTVPRVLAGGAPCNRASDTPVARTSDHDHPRRQPVNRHPSQDRRPPGPVKGPNDWTIRSAFLRQDARATERLVDPD
jgi:hypothetical protein